MEVKTALPHLRSTACVILGGLLAACSSSPPPPSPTRTLSDSEIAVTVNGEPISTFQVQNHASQRRSADQSGNPDDATQELINLMLLSQEAVRQGLHETTAAVEELARQRSAVLAKALIEKRLADMEITTQDLLTEYASLTATLDSTEYQARHILLKDKAQADEVIAQLRLGADFGELARQTSIGPSAREGGDLGWFRAGQMVAPFAQALQRMQVGEVSEPVRTEFGWHVIALQNKRQVPVPEFENVKQRLRMVVQNNRLREYVDDLRADARIDVKAAPN